MPDEQGIDPRRIGIDARRGEIAPFGRAKAAGRLTGGQDVKTQ
jgi:hypothetical protein